MKEALFQTGLIKSIKMHGIRVKKLQSGMGYTVLDLYVKSSFYPGQWWELKVVPTLGTKVGLTALQRQDILDECRWGGEAGCVVAVPVEPGVVAVYWHDPDDNHVRIDKLITTKQRGQQYDIGKIINAVATGAERLRLR